VAVGRLEVVKRFDQCIRAFSEVVSAHPDYTLKIVGSGSQENELKTLVASLGIENSVEFTGVQKNVKEILLNASLMAITSEYEGFSLAALEALECGLPVVAFELLSVREIDAASGAISFVPQGDWKALAAEMNRLIDNREQLVRAGRAAKMRAAEYEPDKIGSLWRLLIGGKTEN
jgi:glycosyltransferase involved in cell wall biosynthesis